MVKGVALKSFQLIITNSYKMKQTHNQNEKERSQPPNKIDDITCPHENMFFGICGTHDQSMITIPAEEAFYEIGKFSFDLQPKKEFGDYANSYNCFK
jgi:hypothetical protein